MKNLRLKWLKESPSARISLVLITAIVFFRFVYPPASILTWDVFGYYLYLPATFIYHDLCLNDIGWVNRIIAEYQTTATLYQALPIPGGGYVMKYSMGMAVLNAPAFLVAHGISLASGAKADGFSLPYQYAWAISGLVYAAIGIFMLRKILLKYFDEKITSAVLVLTVLATNYFQLTAFDGYLSHNYLFTLYTFILWFTIRWHEKPRPAYALGLGLAMGMAVLVRPSEMVGILIPLFWNISGRQSLREKTARVTANFSRLLIMSSAAIAVGMLQLAYWKYSTGHWLFYSYTNAGEGFDFTHPYLKEVLFSFRKGWLIYTPVMVLALAGMVSLYRSARPLFAATLIYFLVNLYVVSSWTCWWYAGGSYSQRALLSSYAVLALPLGFLLRDTRKRVWRKALYLAAAGLLILNLFQTWQWAHGLIDRTRMTRAYYFAIFGKTSVSDAERKLLLVERPNDEVEILRNETDYARRTALFLDFENNATDPFLSDTASSGKKSARLSLSHPFSAGFEMPYRLITPKDHAWLRTSVMVYPTDTVKDGMASLVMTFQHQGVPYHYRALSISDTSFRMKAGQWNRMQLDYLTPEVRSVNDSIKVYFWLQGNKPVLIDDLKIEIFD
jgi:hypothetical protein